MSFFSVVIPTFNNAKVLPRAIESILRQKFQDWELVIVDDGSTDDTSGVIAKYLLDKRITGIYQQNKGVTSARNSGLGKTSGRYITFLDSDDEVSTNWLQDFYDLIVESPFAGYLSCAYYINDSLKLPKLDLNISPQRYSSLAGTFAIREDVIKGINGYDPNLKQSENWEMTARAIEFCLKRDLILAYTENANFKYYHQPSVEDTRKRDEYRAEATYYLYKKYHQKGVLHYRRKDFLLSSAVNFTRAGKFDRSRKMFYKNFLTKPTLQNFLKIIVFEIPFFRRKKWERKESKNNDY